MNVGDIVTLKSGGPLMTIGARVADGDCECIWFDADERMQRQWLPSHVLALRTERTEKAKAKGQTGG